MVGGAEKGKIYVEIPLKAMFFGSAKTPQDRWAVWDTFFGRVLRERPDFTRPVQRAWRCEPAAGGG